MSIQENLQRLLKAWQKGKCLLFREGTFWRTYEMGALTLCEYVHDFKVTTRYFKTIGQWVALIGFPLDSQDKWLAQYKVEKIDDKTIAIALKPEERKNIDDNFSAWKENQIIRAKSQQYKVSTETNAHHVVAESAPIGNGLTREEMVLMKLRSFSLENASPLQCLNFVAELKQMLSSNG